MGTYWSLENLVYYFFSVLLSHLFVLYMIKDTDCVCNFCVNKDRVYVIWNMPACLLTLWISRSKVMSAGLLTITECLKYLLVYHCFISNSIQHHLDAHNTSWKKYPKNIPFWFSGRGSGLSLMQPQIGIQDCLQWPGKTGEFHLGALTSFRSMTTDASIRAKTDLWQDVTSSISIFVKHVSSLKVLKKSQS